jgi:hypothetical protein
MSDSSQVQLRYRPEVTWGEDPSTRSPQSAMRELRFTSESLNFTANTAVSDEIRSDRQVADIIRTSVEAGGDVSTELSFGAFDDLFEGAFYSDWTAEQDSNTVSPEASGFLVEGSPDGTVISLGSPSLGGETDLLNALTVGSFIELTESIASPTNNGFTRVTANSGAGSITVSPALPTTGVDTFRVRASNLRNGTTLKSFLLEKEFADKSEHISFSGMRVGTANINIAPGAILTGGFSFQGETATAQTASLVSGLISPDTISVASNDVFNAVDNIGNILIDGAVDANLCFTEISFSIENNLRVQPCIGQLENSGIGIGRVNVTGTLIAYFEDRTFYERYLNFTTTSLSFTAALGGNTYLFDFPSFKFTGGEVIAGGNDQDVLASMEFTAKRDPTLDFTVGLNRFGTIPTITA